jgi:glycosyltransferase involved in cell wall biosynthesis
MGEKQVKVLHIDTEYCWRGGQQQAAYLLQGMIEKKYKTAMLCQPNSALHRFCANNDLPHFSLKIKGEYDIVAGYKIAQVCKIYRFNILHLHSAHAVSVGIWAKLFSPKLKLIAMRRVDFHISKNCLSYLKYSANIIDKIICISERIKQVLIEDGIPEKKLTVIHSGIDLKKYSNVIPVNLYEKYNIPKDNIVVGTVAALVGHKDYPTLLHAAKKVIDTNSNVTFIALGSGKDERKIKKLAEDLRLKEKFIFAGFQENIGGFLKSFDIFVLSSKLEGLGTSILDAMAVGIPVIATEAGGIPEIIRNGKNGLLIPIQNPKDLAEAVILLANDKNRREQLVKAGKESVKKFDIHKTIQQNIELYNSLCSK